MVHRAPLHQRRVDRMEAAGEGVGVSLELTLHYLSHSASADKTP